MTQWTIKEGILPKVLMDRMRSYRRVPLASECSTRALVGVAGTPAFNP